MTVLMPTLPSEPTEDGFGALIALIDDDEQVLPLQSVRVDAHLCGGLGQTVIEQCFMGLSGESAVEVVHIFPLPPDGAVTEVKLVCGDLTVRADCREREEAEAVFEEARDKGHRAALLTAERPDVHTLRVTNLPPGEEVRVRIVVIEVLPIVDGRFRWRFPTVVAPRFHPGLPTEHTGAGTHPDTSHVPDASRISPPIRLEGGTSLELQVRIDGPVTGLASSQHATQLALEEGGVGVGLAQQATCDRDFVLAYSMGRAERSAGHAWTDGEGTVVVVEPPTEAFVEAMPRDVVFVIDVSGSMQGAKLRAAKRALVAALHGLMPTDRFRLIAFSHEMRIMKPEWSEVDDASLAEADRWVRGLKAQGGTSMLKPIRDALTGATPEGRLRTILFITDGQAGNEEELVAAVAARRQEARFFTLGIDTAVNRSLLDRLARVGGGTAEYAAPGDDIEALIASIEARFGSPLAVDVSAEGALGPADLFAGRPAFLWIPGAHERVVAKGQGFSQTIDAERTAFPIGALLARRQIAQLEDAITAKPWTEESTRAEIVRLALAHHLASRFTAFVAVERSTSWEGERVSVTQPVELPHAWDVLGVAGNALPPAPMMSATAMWAPSAARSYDARPGPARRSAPAWPSRTSGNQASEGLVSRSLRALASLVGGQAPVEPEVTALGAEAAAPVTGEPGSVLARSQGADGSFAGDVARTAAALLALVVLGHTRRVGIRRRTVLKASRWLESHASDPRASLALDALAAAEAGTPPSETGDWSELLASSPEGALLRAALDSVHGCAARVT